MNLMCSIHSFIVKKNNKMITNNNYSDFKVIYAINRKTLEIMSEKHIIINPYFSTEKIITNRLLTEIIYTVEYEKDLEFEYEIKSRDEKYIFCVSIENVNFWSISFRMELLKQGKI